MADFLPAFESMILAEGGYVLHTVAGDRGGMTYAGISRKAWPQWAGWTAIDYGDKPEAEHVRHFYRTHFWAPLQLDRVASQEVARTIFDFAVNAGTSTAVKLAQITVGATPDGKVGPKTIALLNMAAPELFMARYALAKMARYAQIVTRDRTQGKFLLGWLNRTLKEAA